MQKFNLLEVVTVTTTGPRREAVIIDIMTSMRWYQLSKSMSNFKVWAEEYFDCDVEEIWKDPVYILELYKPCRPISFLDWCNYYDTPSNPQSKKLYEQSVKETTQICAPERDLEFIADSMDDFLKSFDSDKAVEDWADNYC